jgi:hypothetical protein
MIQSAFPDGLPLWDYFPLLCLFRQKGMSFRGVAEAMEACFDIEVRDVLNDAYGTEGPDVPVDEIDRVRQHLLSHGFEVWQRER